MDGLDKTYAVLIMAFFIVTGLIGIIGAISSLASKARASQYTKKR